MEQTEILTYAKAILNQELLISLSTCDTAGNPWAAVVEFAAGDDLTLYWLSDPESRHSRNISQTVRAAGTVTLPLDEKENGIGLQLEGTVRVVLGEEIAVAQHLRETKRGEPINPELLKRRSFYALTPDRIYLIHEPLLGYKRLELQLTALDEKSNTV